MGVLTVIDRAALAAYCQAWGRWVEAEEKLRETPILFKTPSGYVQQSPWLGIANKQLELMGRYMVELGLTPARSRVSRPMAAPGPIHIETGLGCLVGARDLRGADRPDGRAHSPRRTSRPRRRREPGCPHVPALRAPRGAEMSGASGARRREGVAPARTRAARHGVLTVIDRAALAAYCQAWGRWVEAEEKLRETPTLFKTPSGHVQQSPWLGIANKQLELMGRYMVELGLTPAARSRVTAVPMTPPSEPITVTIVGGRELADYSDAELIEILAQKPKDL